MNPLWLVDNQCSSGQGHLGLPVTTFAGIVDAMPSEANRAVGRNDRAARIYRKLKGVRGVDDDEVWQHALFFAMTPDERCQFSLKTARSALSLRRFTRKG